jgi:hypothetical protein
MAMAASGKVVAGRVVLLAAAVAAVIVALLAHGGRESRAPQGGVGTTFFCPMHRQVVAPVPGACPICRMALEPQRGLTEPGAAVPARAGDARGATFSLPPGTARLLASEHVAAKRRQVSGAITAPARLDGDRGGYVLLYDGDAAAGQQARFQPASGTAAAGNDVDVRLTGDPPRREDGGIVRMRFELAAGAPRLPSRATGWLALERRSVDAVTVPHAAILETPDGTFAFVVSADRRAYSKRSVAIGRHFAGQAVVLSGVNEGEQIAVAKGFVLATEQRLGEASGSHAEATP